MVDNKRKKVTLHTLKGYKAAQHKVVFLTAYDYPMGSFADRAGVDMILVGDSGGMTMLGHPTTIPVTMDEMLLMSRSVTRAVKSAFVVGDMPFMSYQPSDELAIRNAGRFLAEGGCDAIKCEGGRRMASRIRAMTGAGVAVMGHIGLTPQNLTQLGGYRVQGRTLEAFQELVQDAHAIEEAGAFALLLEAIPNEVAGRIRDQLRIPVYGIGAGCLLDGQLVIVHDMLGMFVGDIKPRFVKVYAHLAEAITRAIGEYAADVRSGAFPSEQHFYEIAAEERDRIVCNTPPEPTPDGHRYVCQDSC